MSILVKSRLQKTRKVQSIKGRVLGDRSSTRLREIHFYDVLLRSQTSGSVRSTISGCFSSRSLHMMSILVFPFLVFRQVKENVSGVVFCDFEDHPLISFSLLPIKYMFQSLIPLDSFFFCSDVLSDIRFRSNTLRSLSFLPFFSWVSNTHQPPLTWKPDSSTRLLPRSESSTMSSPTNNSPFKTCPSS